MERTAAIDRIESVDRNTNIGIKDSLDLPYG